MTTTTTKSQVSLDELLTPVSRPVRLVGDDFYRSLGVKWYAKGLFIKEPTKGSHIKATRLFVVENGDFIYNRLFAWKGSFALCGSEHAGCVVSSEFPTFRVNAERLMPAYLMAFFSNAWLWEMIAGQSSGTAEVSRLRFKEMEFLRLAIPLPPLPEQERIVKLLDEADELHKLRAQADRRTAELIPALFHEMFGDPATNPKHWPMRRLRDLAEKFSDGPFGSNLKSSHYTAEGIRVIRLQNVGIGCLVDENKVYISPAHFQQLRKHECVPGDVIVGTLGDPNLRACVLPAEISQALNKADCVQIRPSHNISTAEFICWLLNLPSTLTMASGMIAGQTRARISMGRLAGLTVPVPPIERQKEFAAQVAEVRAMETEQAVSRRRLDELFQSLLLRAFARELSTQDADDSSVAVSLKPIRQRHQATTVKHSKGIMYRRAALDCYLITALKGDPNLARTKIEKICHLMEYHCGLDLERAPLRDAAGPNDYPSRMNVESLARKQKWYFTRKVKVKVDYLPGREISKSRRTAENFLGERKSAVDALISLLRPLDTKESEIVATLYAAWNDFLLAGKTPTDDELITEVRHNWHPEKLKIPPDQWIKGLAWMRKNQLIPRGVGKTTIRNKSV